MIPVDHSNFGEIRLRGCFVFGSVVFVLCAIDNNNNNNNDLLSHGSKHACRLSNVSTVHTFLFLAKLFLLSLLLLLLLLLLHQPDKLGI